jgi:hypothetical protein
MTQAHDSTDWLPENIGEAILPLEIRIVLATGGSGPWVFAFLPLSGGGFV